MFSVNARSYAFFLKKGLVGLIWMLWWCPCPWICRWHSTLSFFLTRRHFVSRSCSSGCRSLYFRFPRLVHSQPFIKQQRKDWWLQSSIVKNLSWLHCRWWLHYPSVPNPGRSWFDTTMSMSVHNSKICSKAFYGQYKIRHIRKFLSPETTKLLSMHSSLLTWTTAILFSMMSPITNLIVFRKY